MRWTLVLLAVPLMAEDAVSRAARVRASMEASLARQRMSLARQNRRPGAGAGCAPATPAELAGAIGAAAERHGLYADLIREVARQESAFHPCAVSAKGAQGLMQLMPATQAHLNVRNPFDPRESIDAGAHLLKLLLDRYHGDLALALSAYNAGPARVDPILAIPPIPETRNYVSAILARLATPRP